MPDSITIPPELRPAVDEDDYPQRLEWLARLPATVRELAADWGLELGEPFIPGGQCAWVAPAGENLVLKVGWRHREAEHEADALRLWDGDGAIRCFATRTLEDTTASLLERCVPGTQLKLALPELEQDAVVARVLCRLWRHKLPERHPFGSLEQICDLWVEWLEARVRINTGGADPGLVREGVALLRELPRTAERSVLVCTDLHAGNVLLAQREPWLAIDPKPFVGDPAFDPVQHMLNCDRRLAGDPVGLARRMAGLLDLDVERVSLWLLARCAQESLDDPTMREPARILAGARAGRLN
ncbi:MAG TPA: aminoglycoside phosphotransferase family protein [Solirubrobacteraceae bacterium]